MAQTTTHRTRLRRICLTAEATYGTTPTMVPFRFLDPGPTLVTMQDNLANAGQSQRLYDHLSTVQALKSWTLDGQFNPRCETGILNAAATATTGSMIDLFTTALGGYHAAAGSLVASASDGTAITVTGGQGSRFAIGTWIGVGVAGVLEFAKITNIATDTLSLSPTLSGTPGAGQVVTNSYSYWPTESRTNTLAVTGASVDQSADQYTLNHGVVTSYGFKITPKTELVCDVKLAGKLYTGPSSQSLSTAVVSDVWIPPMPGSATYYFLQPVSTTTRVETKVIACDIGVAGLKPRYLEEFAATANDTSAQQTSGVINIDDRLFAVANVKCRWDSVLEGYYTSKTPMRLVQLVVTGSGATKRAVITEIPTCEIQEVPVPVDESGQRVVSLKLFSQLDTLNANQTSGTAGAPIVHSFI